MTDIDSAGHRVLTKLLLQLELTTEEAVQKCIELQQELKKEVNISFPLLSLLYHHNDLTDQGIHQLEELLEEKLSHLNYTLPLRVEDPFLANEHLGKAALEVEAITEEQIQEATALQEQLWNRDLEFTIGELLVHADLASTEALRYGRIRNKLEEIEGEPKEVQGDSSQTVSEEMSDVEDRIGKLAVEQDVISEEQLQRALSLYDRFREQGITVRLGELFMSLGYLEQSELEDLLQLQKVLRNEEDVKQLMGLSRDEEKERSEERYLGNLALENELLTQEQLAECLDIQENLKQFNIHRRIGEIMKEKGYVSEDDLQHLLEIQQLSDRQEKSSPSSFSEEALTESIQEEVYSELSEDQAEEAPDRSSFSWFGWGMMFLLIVGAGAGLYFQRMHQVHQTNQSGTMDNTGKKRLTPEQRDQQNHVQGNETRNRNTSDKVWPWQRSDDRTDASKPDSEASTDVESVFRVRGAFPHRPTSPIDVSFRVFLDHEYLPELGGGKWMNSRSYQYELGPFRNREEGRRLPPGYYIIQHRFSSAPLTLPSSLRIHAEPFLDIDLMKILDGRTGWVRFSVKARGERTEIRDFSQNWRSLLQDVHQEVYTGWRPVRDLFRKALKTRQVDTSVFREYFRQLRRLVEKATTRLKSMRSQFLILPYHAHVDSYLQLLKSLPGRSRHFMLGILKHLGKSPPEWLQTRNDEAVNAVHLAKRLEELDGKLHGFMNDQSFPAIDRALKDVIRLEAWRLLQVRRLMDSFWEAGQSSEEFFSGLQQNDWRGLRWFVRLVKSYIALHKTSLNACKLLPDTSFSQACRHLPESVVFYMTRTVQDLLSHRDKALSASLKNQIFPDQSASGSREEFRHKQKQVQKSLGVSSLRKQPSCQPCPDAY